MDSKPINPPVWEGFSVTEIQSAFTTLTESCGYEPTTKTLKLILGSGQPVIMAEDEEAALIYRIMQKLAEIHTRPLEQATTTAQPEAEAALKRDSEEYYAAREQYFVLGDEQLADLAALRSQVAALTSERDAARAFIKDFTNCDYREHGDFVKARELERLQELSDNFVAGFEDGDS